VERHDVYHLLTGCSTAVEDEIAQQYLCLGNGKRSPYLIGVIILGALILPEYAPLYYRSFLRGKKAPPFYDWDFKSLLNDDFESLRDSIFLAAYFKRSLL